MGKRRRGSSFDWGYFLLLIGIVVLFTLPGFVWGVNVGRDFF